MVTGAGQTTTWVSICLLPFSPGAPEVTGKTVITAVDVMKERLVVVGPLESEAAFEASSAADEGVA